MKDRENYIPKKEVTLMKIEMASQAIKEENKRRKKHNAKMLKKDNRSGLLPIIHPAAVPTARKTPGDLTHVRGMDTITHASKRLCGRLSSLCKALKDNGLPYPWVEGGA